MTNVMSRPKIFIERFCENHIRHETGALVCRVIKDDDGSRLLECPYLDATHAYNGIPKGMDGEGELSCESFKPTRSNNIGDNGEQCWFEEQ